MSLRKALLTSAVGASMLAFGAQAQAAVTLVTPSPGTFVEQPAIGGGSGGVYGVELRGGRPGARDWEVGVGQGTSRSGHFNQGYFDWATPTTDYDFVLTWTGSQLSFSLPGVPLTVNDAGVNKAAPLVGNTLKVFVKGVAGLTITEIDGVAFNQSFTTGQEGYFFSNDNFGGDGFVAKGTVRLKADGGSANEVLFKNGDYTAPVPEPGAWALMIAGFGLAGAALRRRRAIAA